MNDDAYFHWSYAAEKFMVAVDGLATSFAPNWQRMLHAIMSISLLRREHVPNDLIWQRIEKLIRKSSEFGPVSFGGSMEIGAFENTLRRRRRTTLEAMANEIVSIDQEISTLRGRSRF